MAVRILLGDVRAKLAELPDESVHCVVTSPPYFGLRDYGTASWEGGDPACDHVSHNQRGDTERETPGGKGGSFRGGTVQFQGLCGKCGATRTDKQIGLEPTPAEFVAVMVEVFREVRRVLRKDGTLWLNLGDSYVSGTGAQVPDGKTNHASVMRPGNPAKNGGASNRDGVRMDGIAPKNLLGIPWRVAFALQQPYYTGKIKSEADRIWLAAMIDGEGCMFIHKRKAGTGNHTTYTKKDGSISKYDRTQDTYGAGLEIANTSEAIINRCMAIVGRGSICSQSPTQNNRRKQSIFRWNMRSNECREVIREIYPHLVGKQHQARLLLGCPSAGPAAEAAHASLMALHNGGEATIDFPAPLTMFEPGFYLRQEIIWSKSNPMPESVTDRCTKAHEQLFLLSKSARYHYDAEAIKEPASENTHARGSGIGVKNASIEASSGVLHNAEYARAINGPTEDRNRRSVWTVATQPFKEAHFATFPPDLIEPCIKAGCPKDCCAKCGAPVVRQVEKTFALLSDRQVHRGKGGDKGLDESNGWGDVPRGTTSATTTGWSPSCSCDAGLVHGTVLDPFGGAGTTGLVADRLGRDAILIELNPEYAELARERIKGDSPLFAEVAA